MRTIKEFMKENVIDTKFEFFFDNLNITFKTGGMDGYHSMIIYDSNPQKEITKDEITEEDFNDFVDSLVKYKKLLNSKVNL